jgi:kinesin family protein 5
VIDVLNGINASILCYGQTGAGKTHTMFGNQEIIGNIIRDYKLYGTLTQRTTDSCGVVLRAMNEILNFKQSTINKIEVNIKYLQIYNERITDLTTGENVVVVNNLLKGSTEVTINDLPDFLSVLAVGERRKKYAETKMNEHSSRAHTVIIVNVSQQHPTDRDKMLCSTLYMVDLAGSEQIKKSEVVGINRMEAI